MSSIGKRALRRHTGGRYLPLVGIAFLALVLSRPAYAYIDPGSGPLLWQWVISLAIGAAFTLRRGLQQMARTLLSHLRRLRRSPSEL